jgi:hypothetical protein
VISSSCITSPVHRVFALASAGAACASKTGEFLNELHAGAKYHRPWYDYRGMSSTCWRDQQSRPVPLSNQYQ